jgi:uncharacterized membrane protein
MLELIRPNIHVAVVHFPIALLTLGILIEVFSFLGWRRSSLRTAGRWMLLLGAMTMVPAALTGLYALSDVAPQGINALYATQPAAAETLQNHLWVQTGTTLAAMLVVTLWIACSDRWRDRLGLLLKFFLLIILLAQLTGAHHGGELVYAHGLGVETDVPSSQPSLESLQKIETWEAMFPPLQMHVYSAGVAMALACVALGWAVRAIAQDDDLTVSEEVQVSTRIAAAFAAEQGDLKQLLSNESAKRSLNHTAPFRVTKLWLLTALLFAGTAIGGFWVLAHFQGTWQPQQLWSAIKTPVESTDPALTRRLAHVICAVSLIVCTVLLALLSRFGRKNRIGLCLVGVPLVISIALQLWLGILLLLHGPGGSVTGY